MIASRRSTNRRIGATRPGPFAGLAFVAVAALAFGCAPTGSSPSGRPSAAASVGTSPAGTTGANGCPTSQPPPLPAGQKRVVTIATAKGTIAITVSGDLAPIAAGNFVALASCGFYNGVVFHRLVPGFVIQGGDPEATGGGGPGYTIADDQVTTTYKRGTVAMARTPAPHSQGSQFFIVLDDAAARSLTGVIPGYAILGDVTAGMETVDAIAAMPNSGVPNNAALQPVAMDKVTVSQP